MVLIFSYRWKCNKILIMANANQGTENSATEYANIINDTSTQDEFVENFNDLDVNIETGGFMR